MGKKKEHVSRGVDSDETHKISVSSLNIFCLCPGDIPVEFLHPPATILTLVSRFGTTVVLELSFPVFCVRILLP